MPQHAKRVREDTRSTYVRETPNRRHGDPLDGSTSGTIGGGGPDVGGGADRPPVPGSPAPKPENAASGRLAPDELDAVRERDDLDVGASDVNNAGSHPRPPAASDRDRAPRRKG